MASAMASAALRWPPPVSDMRMSSFLFTLGPWPVMVQTRPGLELAWRI